MFRHPISAFVRTLAGLTALLLALTLVPVSGATPALAGLHFRDIGPAIAGGRVSTVVSVSLAGDTVRLLQTCSVQA